MKKSEYIEKRREKWNRLFSSSSLSAEHHVELDVVAAEAAGVVWDPEEEPLHETIYISELCGDYGSDFYLHAGSSEKHIEWKDDREKGAHYTEAVRRYNAWPELEKLADGIFTGDRPKHWSERLREILRGGAS